VLTGLKVLDLAGELGWLAARLLADLGADVIRIEAPGPAAPRDATWRANNVNKRLLELDPLTEANRLTLDELMAAADVLIETWTPGSAAARLFDPARLGAAQPHLIHVSITPFGHSGPRANWPASDLEIMAAGGALSLAGEPEGAPTRVTAPQSGGWAGAHGAVGALIALHERTSSDRGQHVDVSAQSAVIMALAHAPAFWDVLGKVATRAGAYVTGRSVAGARYRAFWPCRDGYLNFVLYGGAAGRRTNQGLIAWMKECGADLGALAEVDWQAFDPTRLGQDEVERLEAVIEGFLASISKSEFLEQTTTREMMGYPVFDVGDVTRDPQLAARGFWQQLGGDSGAPERHCGAFAIIDGERPALRFAPGTAAGTAESCAQEWGGARPAVAGRHDARGPALGDLKVVEFGGFAAGPQVGKIMANYGATVVHLEAADRPDGFRLQYPPYPDNRPGINRSGCFAMFNDSKLGVTVDLKQPAGLELARRLVDWADVVVENMRPGVMARLGLGYETLTQSNPGLVMLSTCNMGQSGSRAKMPGFGTMLSALAGFCGLTGQPDGPPMLLYGPYIDFVAALFGLSAVLAALERRRHSGRGALIDLAQYETGLLFLAGPLLAYQESGRVLGRSANRDAVAAPHGTYLAADGRWLALSCWSDRQFAALAGAIGEAAAAQDERFATAPARQSQAEALDALVSGWCAAQPAAALVSALRQAAVPVYAVNDMRDLFEDEQIRAAATWQTRPHAEMGPIACYLPAMALSATPPAVGAAAPLLGQHNDYVFAELLGLSQAEIQTYQASGVFGAG
jgi:crotonobetainyl-CoA:carnitine CoA-transferase CaiB-like acyl-CoA transferase